MKQAIAAAYDAGYLGADVAGSGCAFELQVRLGGAYICVRKPRCSSHWKGVAARSASSRRCRH